MKAKTLKKYTTIPQSLYVNRKADQQLKDIIEEMQRPGYVLVARQMGKTNLLFNAKRNLESEDRKFVYIDLSNNFETERECYNFIIDSILDIYDDELWEIRSDIESIREKTRTDHISYTKSLLSILKSLKTDLVIILDEIDALRTSEYSDNIFAVIRSNYFTRSNFPEFENLTYILSGVIEPKDLIKDKNKSPFNIGEKIYLDDFTYDEYLSFITKSNLNLSKENSDRIYEWTSGNPRLTFDLCSDIETILSEKNDINSSDIDQLVEFKYLTNYDIAPIDHIRELISENKDVQNAIINIIEGNLESSSISDSIINKLYLYGITAHQKKNSDIKIKSEILKKSIPLSWLRSLTENCSENLDKAIKLIDNACNYYDAIDILQSIINNDSSELEVFELSLALHYLGTALHQIRKYEESNIYLNKKPISKNASPTLHFRQKFFTGLNYHQLGNSIDGNHNLKYVIDNYKNTATWANAALNFAIHNLNGNESYLLLKEIISENFEIETEIETEAHTLSIMSEIKSYAYYYLSSCFNKESKDETLSYINSAIDLQIVNHIPALMIKRAELTETLNVDNVNNIIDYIIENQIKIDDKSDSNILLTYNNNLHFSLLSYSFTLSIDMFNRFKKYTKDSLKISEESIYLKSSNMPEDINIKYDILNHYVINANDKLSKKVLRRHSINSILIEKDDYDCFYKYIMLIHKENDITINDIGAVNLILRNFFMKSLYYKVIDLVHILSNNLLTIDNELNYNSSAIYYWGFESALATNNAMLCYQYGIEVLNRLNSDSKNKSFFTEEGERTIKEKIYFIVYSTLNENTHIHDTNISNKFVYNKITSAMLI